MSSAFPKWKRRGLALIALVLAAAIWFPLIHFFFRQKPEVFLAREGIAPAARSLAERHLRLWTDPALREAEIRRMRGTNAEWDFMGRTFFVWSLANMALRDPVMRPACLEVMDRILDETLRLEKERGHLYFLMDYAGSGNFVYKPDRSLFVDGEIALMLGMRRLVEEKIEYKAPMRERIDGMIQRMRQSPVLSAESYPNECWMFCNAVALAAIKMGDFLDGTDQSVFLREWVEMAKQKLTHRETGLLVSSYTPEGQVMDGPEGSSIWMAAHCLAVVDPAFARDQYERAKREIGASALGFGYAREWPRSWVGKHDVDSGPIVPLLEASAGSSGLAFLGAATFGDTEYLAQLLTTLNFAAFPSRRGGALKYCASNQVGDAVMLYAATTGPVWDKVLKGKRR